MVNPPARSKAFVAFHRARAGQTSTEFLVLLGIMTALGYFIMKSFAPTDGSDGAIRSMSKKATDKIATDR